MEKIIVIGSNSFSGSAFIKESLSQGFEVIGLSRSNESDSVFLPHRWLNDASLQNYRFYQCDLNHDLADIMGIIHHEKPSYVVNFAAQSMVAESWLYPEDWMMTNVLSMVKFHEQLRTCDFVKKYVHISTPEVYGSCQGSVPTTMSYNPSTPYAVSRAAADMWLSALFKNYQFPVVFTRAANVYGAGQQLYRIIPKTILSIKKGLKLPLHGGGHSVRSFIHIQDVAVGTIAAMLNGKAGQVYHFSTQRNISIRQLVESICHRLHVDFEDSVLITDDRPGKDAAYLLDSATSYTELAWKDSIDLEAGIDETVAWIDKYFDQLKDMPLDYIHKK